MYIDEAVVLPESLSTAAVAVVVVVFLASCSVTDCVIIRKLYAKYPQRSSLSTSIHKYPNTSKIKFMPG